MKALVLAMLLVSVPAWAGEDCNAKGSIFSVCADQGKNLDDGLARAKADKKPLLVVAGANWCPWCQSLHRFLQESDLPEAGAYTIVDIALYNGQDKIPSGSAALDRVLKMAGVKKQPNAIPIIVMVNPVTEKAELVKMNSLEKNTKVSKGYDTEKLFAALEKASARVK